MCPYIMMCHVYREQGVLMVRERGEPDEKEREGGEDGGGGVAGRARGEGVNSKSVEWCDMVESPD